MIEMQTLMFEIARRPIRAYTLRRTSTETEVHLICSQHVDPYADGTPMTLSVNRDQLIRLHEEGLLPVHVASSLRRRGMLLGPVPSLAPA